MTTWTYLDGSPSITEHSPDTPDEVLGERIHLQMRRMGATQKQLAAHMNVTQTTVSMKLAGNRPWTLNDVVKAAEFLRVNVSDLTEAVDEWRRAKMQERPDQNGQTSLTSLPRLDSNQQPSGYTSPQVSAPVVDLFTRERVA